MQQQIDEYKLSPTNELNLQNRLHQVDELQKNIADTRQIFSKYIENGKEMCQDISKLAKNFDLCISQDKSLTPIINILSKFETILNGHYQLIQSTIITQIDKFLGSDIKKAENDGKTAKQENSSFSKLLDSYVSIPIKKRSQNSTEFTDLETKLIAQNWVAIKSNFSFARSLDLIEQKSVLELTSCVCIIFFIY